MNPCATAGRSAQGGSDAHVPGHSSRVPDCSLHLVASERSDQPSARRVIGEP